MPRIIPADELRARLGRELDTLQASDEALYVSRRGRLVAVLVDADRYAEMIEHLQYLDESLVALQAREEADQSVPWEEVRG